MLENQALLLHGGIPTSANGLEEIATAHLTHPEESHLAEILWNDPSTINGMQHSPQGIGKTFGIDVASKFLKKINVNMLIRGHECFNDGYYFHNNKILTLFSCKLPHYRIKKLAYLQIPLNERYNRETLEKYVHQL